MNEFEENDMQNNDLKVEEELLDELYEEAEYFYDIVPEGYIQVQVEGDRPLNNE